MKNKLVKGLVTLSLAAVLALSGVTTMGTGLNEVEAAKIVANKTLSAVTGIGYNAEDEKIYWNKVPGATEYTVKITYPDGYTYTRETSNLYVYSYLSAGTYKVEIEAVDYDSIYVVAKDVQGYNPPANWTGGTTQCVEKNGVYYYTFYSYPTSKGAGQIVVPNKTEKKVVPNAITAIPGLVVKEVTESHVYVKPSAQLNLNEGETVYVQYANNPEFKSNYSKDMYSYTTSFGYYYDEDDDEYYGSDKQEASINLNYFTPGETIYVRARVYNENYGAKWVESEYYSAGGYWSNDTAYDKKFGPYTKTLTYAMAKTKITGVTTVTTANSVSLRAYTERFATGYQFEKKVGSKWVTLETQTDPYYVDSALAKNTKYQYRVRAYTYNEKSKKTVWTDWYTVNTTTWGSNLNLKAAANNATSVKLTWKPVSGAEGYEIYRYDYYSSSQTIEKGVGVEETSKQYLVKTIKKAKAKSYTDKKLAKNGHYSYRVRAYRTIGKQKVYLEAGASVDLSPSSLSFSTGYYNAKGQYVVNWNKKTGIKGYYVEQWDRETSDYKKIKTLKASATSYTFPAVAVGSQSVEYRIRPYSATTVYSGDTVTVSGALATPTGVKAVKTATGVKVTWKAVPGADYYRVYRTKNSSYTYDKTRKTYSYSGGETVYEAAVNTENCHPELGSGYSTYNSAGTYRTYKVRGTSVEDCTLTYKIRSTNDNDEYIKVGQTADGKTIYQTEDYIYNEGPEAGTTYSYYVVACVDAANGNKAVSASSYDSKASKVTYTNAIAKKVSKITSAKSSKKGQATISYKKVKGVDGYAIYRSTKKNGTYVLVGTTSKTKFTDASAPAGKKCFYKVASYVKGEKKANIYSAKTAAKQVKIK